jgi:hypothetical protein
MDLTVYAITTPHLPGRAAHLHALLTRNLALPYRWVTTFEPEEVRRLPSDVVDAQSTSHLHSAQISNCLKHLAALRLAAQRGPQDVSLVLEDDTLTAQPGCVDLVMRVAEQLPPSSVCFLGQNRSTGDVLTPQALDDPGGHLMVNAYLVTGEAAKALLEVPSVLPVHGTGSDMLKEALRACSGRVESLRTGRPLLIDGSKYAYFASTLTSDNALVFNPHYMRLRSLLTTTEDGSCSAEDVDKEINDPENVAASHPDFLSLVAQYHTRKGQLEEAAKLLRRAYDTVCGGQNAGLVNNASSVLVRLIELHRHLQD